MTSMDEASILARRIATSPGSLIPIAAIISSLGHITSSIPSITLEELRAKAIADGAVSNRDCPSRGCANRFWDALFGITTNVAQDWPICVSVAMSLTPEPFAYWRDTRDGSDAPGVPFRL